MLLSILVRKDTNAEKRLSTEKYVMLMREKYQQRLIKDELESQRLDLYIYVSNAEVDLIMGRDTSLLQKS